MIEPTVLINEESGEITASPEGVRLAIREYWKSLYKKLEEMQEVEREWLNSETAKKFQAQAEDKPFEWRRNVDLDQLQAFLRKGNHTPSPGPDGWEKWTVTLLSDKGLTLVLKLLQQTIDVN